jgi:phage baseplate assembly protein V
MEENIAKNNRLIHNMVLWGQVKKTDYSFDTGRVWVSLGETYKKSEGADEDLIALPWLRRRGGKDWEWWPPEEGEQVLILAPGGKVERGVIIGSLPYLDMPNSMINIHRPDGTAPATQLEDIHAIRYQDETEVSYNKTNKSMKIASRNNKNFATKIRITPRKVELILDYNEHDVQKKNQTSDSGPVFTLVVDQSGKTVMKAPEIFINGNKF